MPVKKGEPRLLRIREIQMDPKIYPRTGIDWKTVYNYQLAMNAGSVFPPITVGNIEKFKGIYLIDGWHRWKATKQRGEEFIGAEVMRFGSKGEAFVEALRRNIGHGKPLSIYEKVRAIKKLEGLKFKREEISQIIKIPINNIKRLMLRKIALIRGAEVALKTIVESRGAEVGASIEEIQEKLHGISQVELLSDLLILLENDLLDLDDPKVAELADKVHKALRRSLVRGHSGHVRSGAVT